MKKNYIVELRITVCLVLLFSISACNEKEKAHEKHTDPGALQIDSSLSHLLKPSNAQVVSQLPVITAEYGTKIITEEAQGIVNYDTRDQSSISSRVGGRIERLYIKYNYQPVRKGQLIMEVYSPDLAAAQQELLFIYNSRDEAMLGKAKQRLMLLGMTGSGINTLLKTGKVSYRIPVYSNADGYILEQAAGGQQNNAGMVNTPSNAAGMDNMGGDPVAKAAPKPEIPVNTPVLLREGQYLNAGQSIFTIYNADRLVAEFSLKPALAAHVKKGDKLIFYRTSDQGESQPARLGLIQPSFRAGQNFTLARVYLQGQNFRVGELLTARIPVLLTASWWLPESAVVALGNKHIVFKKEGNVFVAKSVAAGIVIGGMVQVKENIGDWKISKNAAYLVDSESFIKMTTNTQH